MTIDTISAEIETLRRRVATGDLVEAHGRLVTREELANVEHIEGGIRWSELRK